MLIMAYTCLAILVVGLAVATLALAAEDNADGTLGGAIMLILVILAIVGVINR